MLGSIETTCTYTSSWTLRWDVAQVLWELASLQGHSQQPFKGHGHQERSLKMKTGDDFYLQEEGSRELQASQPDIRPWKANRATHPRNHFQTHKG